MEILTQPKQQTILIKNTTVWTSESEGYFKKHRCIT
jgi:hypothetical protein